MILWYSLLHTCKRSDFPLGICERMWTTSLASSASFKVCASHASWPKGSTSLWTSHLDSIERFCYSCITKLNGEIRTSSLYTRRYCWWRRFLVLLEAILSRNHRASAFFWLLWATIGRIRLLWDGTAIDWRFWDPSHYQLHTWQNVIIRVTLGFDMGLVLTHSEVTVRDFPEPRKSEYLWKLSSFSRTTTSWFRCCSRWKFPRHDEPPHLRWNTRNRIPAIL